MTDKTLDVTFLIEFVWQENLKLPKGQLIC